MFNDNLAKDYHTFESSQHKVTNNTRFVLDRRGCQIVRKNYVKIWEQTAVRFAFFLSRLIHSMKSCCVMCHISKAGHQ